jgi:peptidoglycan/xylan/chitin deacetylase (PgdA/CDA1 family)
MSWEWVGVGGTAGTAIGLAAWSVRGRSSQVFAPSVWRGDRTVPRIALTFDDGPSPWTGAILDLLGEYGAKGTFFQIGVEASRSPELARRASREGHEIGNHTFSHQALYAKTPGGVYGEVAGGQRVLSEIHGRPPRWFRAPYGCRWFGLRKAQREQGLTGVMWTCLGLDWKLPAQQVAARVLAHAANGAIICLHDGQAGRSNPDCRATVGALKVLLPALRDRQFDFATVSEVFA